MAKFQKPVTLVAVLGLAHWFFGNLYEAFVFSPNWVVDSPEQMRRLNEFFVRSSPTLYFVPLTQLATFLVFYLYFSNRREDVRSQYRNAALFALAATFVNGFIVATLITKLFGADYARFGANLTTYCARWNVFNVARMMCVAATIAPLFKAYLVLERTSAPVPASDVVV